MNTKHRKIFPILTIVLIHIFLICQGGYFLSPEFTVYPYLTSIGLKPYLNIIDQHLPVIFFGPLSLPSFLTQNPQPLLALFLSLTALTDVLFFTNLKKNKIKNSILWTALFATSMFIFGGNTLWLETLIVPLILLLFLFKSTFFLGFLLSLVILIRPTLAPAVLLLLIFKKTKLSRSLVAGFFFPLLITLTYLVHHQLLPSFLDLFFNFNANYYSALAGKLPSLRQIALVGLIILPALFRQKPLAIFIILLSLLPAWPRFELTHLQPAIALAIYLYATNTSFIRHSAVPRILIIILLILSVRKITTANYGNFYLTPETLQAGNYLKTTNQDQLFVLGGSDLLYPLSGKTPAGEYYLPSLPWYYANPNFVLRQIEALSKNPNALVVINTPLASFTQPVYQYILGQYSRIHTVGSYQVYKIKP
jgi:hypothetical protein